MLDQLDKRLWWKLWADSEKLWNDESWGMWASFQSTFCDMGSFESLRNYLIAHIFLLSLKKSLRVTENSNIYQIYPHLSLINIHFYLLYNLPILIFPFFFFFLLFFFPPSLYFILNLLMGIEHHCYLSWYRPLTRQRKLSLPVVSRPDNYQRVDIEGKEVTCFMWHALCSLFNGYIHRSPWRASQKQWILRRNLENSNGICRQFWHRYLGMKCLKHFVLFYEQC